MIDLKALVLFMTLMDYQELSLYELSVKVGFSIKEVKEAIDYLHAYLEKKNIDLRCAKGKYFLEKNDQQLTDIVQSKELVLPKETRLALIYLYIFFIGFKFFKNFFCGKFFVMKKIFAIFCYV